MKNINQRTLTALALAVGAFLGVSQTANALSLVWLDGPQTGQAYTTGGLTLKAINYDTGTLYNAIPIGTSIGYSGSPGAGVAGGEAVLNAAQSRPAINSFGGEDSWGIVKITDILAVASDGAQHSLYNSVASTFELTAMFWGEKDFSLTQVSAGSGLAASGQIIDGTGMRMDIYSSPVKNFNQVGGPAARTGVSTYPTATDGTLELSLLSTPGFINANGTLGGSATEFESNTANVGYAALNVIGGASASQFNTNAIGFGGSSGALFTPGVAGQTATDVWLSFTSTQGLNGWDITSNDPMLANVAGVPDGGSTLLMLGGALTWLAAACRRSKKSV